MIRVGYQNQYRRVRLRPTATRCNLYQFWDTNRFNLDNAAGVTIYLPPGQGTIQFSPRSITFTESPVCTNGRIASGLPWQSLGNGVQAIATEVYDHQRYNREDPTFMVLVRGLPSSGLSATDGTPAQRFGTANSCGIARFSTTSTYDNANLGRFYWVDARNPDVGSPDYNWSNLLVWASPPLCRNGVLYLPG
jgi:hypothetical protein